MRNPAIKSPLLTEGEKEAIYNLLPLRHYIRELAVVVYMTRETLNPEEVWKFNYAVIIIVWDNHNRDHYLSIYLKHHEHHGKFSMDQSVMNYDVNYNYPNRYFEFLRMKYAL